MVSRSPLLPGLAVILFTALPFHSSSAQLTTLAIIPLEAKGVSDVDASVLTDRLGLELFQLGRFTVLERAKMEEILNEQNFQMSGCVTDECLVEVGRLLGVQQLVAGSVSRIGYTYTVILRLISAETGAILQVANYDHRGVIDELLSQGMQIVASRLVGREDVSVAEHNPGIQASGLQHPRLAARLFNPRDINQRYAVVPGLFLRPGELGQGLLSMSFRLGRTCNLPIPLRPSLTYGLIMDRRERDSHFFSLEASSAMELWKLRLTPLLGVGAYFREVYAKRNFILSAGLQIEWSQGLLSRFPLDMRLMTSTLWGGPVLNLGIGFRF